MKKPSEFLEELIAFDSVSGRSNADISDWCQQELERSGFEVERVEYRDARGVPKSNVVARKGPGLGGLAWFGHTDVVPADAWFRADPGPFTASPDGDRIYGRGACDMKGSLACILSAAGRLGGVRFRKPFYLVCTADEEVGYLGAAEVAARSRLFREMVEGQTCGIIGEPTCLEVVHAHKGTFGFQVTSRGKAAHSSSALGRNANLAMIPFLVEMKRIHDETESDPAWQNPAFDPPTVSWNIGINDHNRAVNIKAARSVCTVYFRPMPGQDGNLLLNRAREAADRCGLEFQSMPSAGPLWTDSDSPFVREMLEATGRDRPRTVCYGTDGTMFSDLKNLVVFGPGDIAQAHTDDEWISCEQLREGTALYERLIRRWCLGGADMR